MKSRNSTAKQVSSATPTLTVHLLGPIDFETCLSLQQRLLFELSCPTANRAVLLLCEHPPLITVGRRGSWAHLNCDRSELASRQLSLRWVNRGGGCWLHMPGQIVAYPILPLKALGLGLREYHDRLEKAVTGVLREFSIRLEAHRDRQGVWGRTGQLAAIGVAVKQWISYYGLYLNVCPDLEPFRLLAAASNGARVSSLEAERCRPVSMASAREAMIRHLAEKLGFGRHYYLMTGHPALQPKKPAHAYAHRVG